MRLLRSLRARLRPRRGSELDHVIPAEIIGDRLHAILEQLAAREGVRHILEIGSSSGEGSTAALARGACRNPSAPRLHCMEVSAPRFERLVDQSAAPLADAPAVKVRREQRATSSLCVKRHAGVSNVKLCPV